MIGARKYFETVQNAILFTCFFFTVPYLVAFIFQPDGVDVITQDVFVKEFSRSFMNGVMIAIVLLGRDLYWQRRKKNARA